MNLKNYFNVSRFWLLLRMELYRSKKAVLITFVITFGMLFFVSLLLDIIIHGKRISYEHHENYAFTLLIGGFVLSSLSFNDLTNTLKKYRYLTLPVSTLEKFLSMWLLTSVGWILVFSIVYGIYTFIANAIGNFLFSQVTFENFKPWGGYSLKVMQYYFVLQGIFLVGAAHFKGHVFPKTLFTLILFAALCGLVAYLIMLKVINSDFECEKVMNPLLEMPAYNVWLVIKSLFWWAFAPLCWITTYLGLKEQEV